jgi:ATP-binding cassette subfamily F protein uup
MRMLCGEIEPDSGEITLAPGAFVSLLPQDVPQDLTGTIREVVTAGIARRPPDATLDQHEAEWRDERRIEQILSRMELPADDRFELLSSGMKRRVLLAQAIVSEPELLLLDEPTNHLDIDAITWLEEFLLRWKTTLLFVTHDRMFLRKLATRILEVDRGRIFDWSCDYATFLRRKEDALAAEEKQNALFDKRLAEEEAWIRQGIKARRTRNEGRVRALKEMREQHRERRGKEGTVRLQIQEANRSGQLVAEVDGITFAYDDKPIATNFSTTIMRGDKVGIIGPNGAGKTTLLRLILGQLQPQQGKVRTGTNLELAYFDQLRQQLDENETVQDSVGEGSDSVGVGEAKQHVIGYLQKFLFAPERARTPIRFLSGGERNRVLLAKLFSKPANVIVLDEPTNDLDAETLELLEERLMEFRGTVLLVSHDREFLNNVVTSVIAFEASGVKEYFGGYDDWQRQTAATSPTPKTSGPTKQNVQAAKPKPDGKRRLSYKEQRELAGLPEAIENVESQIAEMHQQMAEPDFYQQPGDEIASAQTRLKDLESQLSQAYQRWEELEALAE